MGCCGSKPVPLPIANPPPTKLEFVKPPGTDSLSRPPIHQAPQPAPIHPPPQREPEPVHHQPPKAKKAKAVREVPKPKKFECDSGHELLWYSDLPFYFYKLTQNWTIRCSVCQKIYSSAGWHCRSCNYDMCEDCAHHLGKETPKIKCDSGHECTWSPETVFLYNEINESRGFRCNICKETKFEPCWNCTTCFFDCCISCAIKDHKIHPPNDTLICTELHHLTYFRDIKSHISDEIALVCDKCKSEFTEGECFCCQEHGYDLCIKCAKKKICSTTPHPGYLCREDKKMKIEEVAKKKEESGEDDIACEICKNGDMKYAYLCGDCMQCYCLKCSRELSKKIAKCHKLHCKNGHQLKWASSSAVEIKKFKCDTCAKSYSTGLFTCGECNFNICINHLDLQESS